MNVIHDENIFPINEERRYRSIFIIKIKRWNGKKVDYIILKSDKNYTAKL